MKESHTAQVGFKLTTKLRINEDDLEFLTLLPPSTRITGPMTTLSNMTLTSSSATVSASSRVLSMRTDLPRQRTLERLDFFKIYLAFRTLAWSRQKKQGLLSRVPSTEKEETSTDKQWPGHAYR